MTVRRSVRPIVCVLAGAIATIALAWTGTLYSDWSRMKIHPATRPAWPGAAPRDWPLPTTTGSTDHRLANHEMWAHFDPNSARTVGWYRLRAGFPFRALVHDIGTDQTAGGPVTIVTPGVWLRGVALPAGLRDPLRMADFRVPIRPIWLGFLGDTLVYAAAIWLLACAPGLIRRRRRLHRGRCPGCGYSLSGLQIDGLGAVCPECGEVVRQPAAASRVRSSP